MAWVRIHDGAMVNLKISALSDSAFRLWVRGLSYCQTALTDGLIPRAALKDMGAKRKDVDMLSQPQVPGRAPLWEPHPIGFKVHDYLIWNDCRDKVVERQAKAKQRKDEWEAKKRAGREAILNGVPNSVPNGVHDDVRNATKRERTTKPNLTKPNPLPSEEKRARGVGHRHHAFCPPDLEDGFCVPQFLHSQLSTMLGSHGDGFDLLSWYVDTDSQRRMDRPAVGDPLGWWREELKATMQRKGWLRSSARETTMPPTYTDWVCPHDPPCAQRHHCHIKSQLEQAS